MNGSGSFRVHAGVKGDLVIADDRTAPASFEDFFLTRREDLLGALFVLTRDREEAKDISQDAFVAVWERWDDICRLEDPTGYLFRTALNKHRSRIRRARVAARRVLVSPAPSSDADTGGDRADVARALAALPRRQREAIVLTDLLEFDSTQAGRIMGVASSTVRRLTQNAREHLRKSLEVHDE